MEERVLNFEELSEEKKKEFEKLEESYIYILHEIYRFATVNNVDSDDVWDKANQAYDEDLTHAPNDED